MAVQRPLIQCAAGSPGEGGGESHNPMLLLKFCVVALLIYGMDEPRCNVQSISTARDDVGRRARRTMISYVADINEGGGSRRRMLQGSSPPNCDSKCGSCVPCVSVIVPINPTTVTRQDYYPEAWRCRCRNRIYNP